MVSDCRWSGDRLKIDCGEADFKIMTMLLTRIKLLAMHIDVLNEYVWFYTWKWNCFHPSEWSSAVALNSISSKLIINVLHNLNVFNALTSINQSDLISKVLPSNYYKKIKNIYYLILCMKIVSIWVSWSNATALKQTPKFLKVKHCCLCDLCLCCLTDHFSVAAAVDGCFYTVASNWAAERVFSEEGRWSEGVSLGLAPPYSSLGFTGTFFQLYSEFLCRQWST